MSLSEGTIVTGLRGPITDPQQVSGVVTKLATHQRQETEVTVFEVMFQLSGFETAIYVLHGEEIHLIKDSFHAPASLEVA